MIRTCERLRWLAGLILLLTLGKAGGQSLEWPGNHPARLEVTQLLHDRAGPGKPFFLDVRIRNLGLGEAKSVRITGALPDGAELLDSTPIPSRQQSVLSWPVAAMKPGEEQCIRLHLRSDTVPPTGEWTNKVSVSYLSEVGNVHSIDLSRPKLGLTVSSPTYALLGETVPVKITVGNTGTWPAHRTHMTALINGGLIHESGVGDLENEIGDLQAGKTCVIALPVKAQKIGKGQLHLRLTSGESGLLHHTLTVDIRDARARLDIQGPTSVAVDWPCTYNFVVTNDGTDPLPPTKLVAELPQNLTFTRAGGNGTYNQASNSVVWELPECRTGETLTFVVAGTSRVGTPKAGTSRDGALKVMHHSHTVKSIPWAVRLLDQPATGAR